MRRSFRRKPEPVATAERIWRRLSLMCPDHPALTELASAWMKHRKGMFADDDVANASRCYLDASRRTRP